MPPRYKKAKNCRNEIYEYIDDLDAGTDDDNPEMRSSGSTQRYRQDLRWFDEWLDHNEIDSVTEVTSAKANRLGRTLSKEFNGSTPLYRWNRIHAFYEWLKAMELAEENPLNKWHGKKDEKWGMSRTSEQSKRLEEDENYAVTEKDVRLMEENVNQHRIRDQLIIRLLWQTGIRRGEASNLLISDVCRDKREITIRKKVAKYGKKRMVAYQSSLDGLLTEWLDYGYREEMAAGYDHNHLLVGERGAPLSGDRINEIVYESADRAGINRKIYADANAGTNESGDPKPNRWKITAHNIRHGYGTYLVNETDAGIWEVSKQLGHASVSITEDIYVEDDPRAGIDHAHKYGPD
ncbi:tyrosine-type recombinase/integrase [Natronosalvus caseinilyticus]|uniref:tyrosine-type recombinase/integrase n=1 Tax=Natronosalvus caseinilyticus TaxID=2953747 RepID=UPI0028ABB160|nr:site-specific integrase [Natronosalvus caseinilyticus]